jgi:hypothetical protein
VLAVLAESVEGHAAPPEAVRAVALHERPEEADRVICRSRPAPAAATLL